MGSHVAPRTKRSRQEGRAPLSVEIADSWVILQASARFYWLATRLAVKSVADEWKGWPHGTSTD